MGMKLRCFDGSGSANSYHLLENLQDKDSSTEKQEELQFYNDNGSFTSVIVEKNLRAIDLCLLLAVKNRVTKDFCWSIVEHWVEVGLERVLEDHEDVLSVHRQTENSAKKYIFRRYPNKYDFFITPEEFFPSDMVDLRNCRDEEDYVESGPKTYENLLTYSLVDWPLIFSQVCIQSSQNKNIWIKTFLLLRNNKLLMSSKVQVVARFLRQWKNRENCYKPLDEPDPNRATQDEDNHSELQLVADLRDYEVYSCLNSKNHLRAPTEFGICLRRSTEEDFASPIVFSCENDKDRTCWVMAMRLAKYGKQLRENYKAFKNKQEQQSAKDVSANQANENVRCRVAMDFTGSVGRIVEDPNEAKAIAVSEGILWKRRLRAAGGGPAGCGTPGGGACPRTVNRVSSASNQTAHLGQPWFHGGMSRDQANSVISAHATEDGIFVIRESRSQPGCFVLSMKKQDKVIHTTITQVMDPLERSPVLTLDSGVTKFYDLVQLVDFYRLNVGPLPTRLINYLERVHRD